MKVGLEDQDTIKLYSAFLQHSGNSLQTYTAMNIKSKETLINRQKTMILDLFVEIWH